MVDEIYQVSFNKMHLGVTQNHSFFFFSFQYSSRTDCSPATCLDLVQILEATLHDILYIYFFFFISKHY